MESHNLVEGVFTSVGRQKIGPRFSMEFRSVGFLGNAESLLGTSAVWATALCRRGYEIRCKVAQATHYEGVGDAEQ